MFALESPIAKCRVQSADTSSNSPSPACNNPPEIESPPAIAIRRPIRLTGRALASDERLIRAPSANPRRAVLPWRAELEFPGPCSLPANSPSAIIEGPAAIATATSTRTRADHEYLSYLDRNHTGAPAGGRLAP